MHSILWQQFSIWNIYDCIPFVKDCVSSNSLEIYSITCWRRFAGLLLWFRRMSISWFLVSLLTVSGKIMSLVCCEWEEEWQEKTTRMTCHILIPWDTSDYFFFHRLNLVSSFSFFIIPLSRKRWSVWFSARMNSSPSRDTRGKCQRQDSVLLFHSLLVIKFVNGFYVCHRTCQMLKSPFL